ncbi:MAG: hypothetical protein KY469_19455 [Actinobacteria bacterium]|nr:hypothetical protein [Actinomycetota bacterium]
MRRVSASLLLLALTSVLLIAADQPEGCYSLADPNDTPDVHADDVLACRLDTFIKANAARIGNVRGVTGQDTYPTFSPEAPAGSYEAGSGGATLTSWHAAAAAGHTDDRFALTVEGEFEGNIDTLAIDLYAINPVDQYVFVEFWSQLHLEIDGTTVFDTFGNELVLTQYTPISDELVRISFAFTDIWDTLGEVDSTDETHTVRFQINGFTYGDEAVFVYDAVEVPAALNFNIAPGSLFAYQQISTA